ncbi:MAG: M15 family peptidase, partial [Clostridium sp.]
MIKKLSIILLAAIITLNLSTIKVSPYVFSNKTAAFLEDDTSNKSEYITCMKQDLLVLMSAYPEFVSDISVENDNVY